MNFDMPKSKVYIQIDAQSRVTRCDGGYTMPADLTGWTEIDEGTGDRYNLCQSHYFNGGLYTVDGLCRWRYADGTAILRTDEELSADRAERPVPGPTVESRVSATEAAILALMEG